MSRSHVETLRLLCRLREAETDSARGKLALAQDRARAQEEAETTAHTTFETLTALADTYVARHIRKMAPTQDGASVYAALAFGAVQRRQDAAHAELQHRRAIARRAEAEGDAESAAAQYLGRRAQAHALGTRRDALNRAENRRAAQREDETIAEARAALVALGLGGN